MQFGWVSGIESPLSRLIQGTLMLPRVPKDQAFELLDAVYEAGARVFDTAPIYGRGLAERRLGEWLRARNPSDVVIIDKGGHPRGGQSRVTPRDIEADLAVSTQNLGVEPIDLYLLHRDQTDVPVAELVDCLHQLASDGRIRRFGVSNWSHTRIEEANCYAATNARLGVVASSPEFNLAVPVNTWHGCLSIAGDEREEQRAWYAKTQLAVLCWSPLAGGFLTGAYTPTTHPESDEQRRVLEFYRSPQNFERLARLGELSRRRGESLATLALAYVLSSEMNTFATLGCASGAEFVECSKALELRLTRDEIAWLERAEPAEPAYFSKE